MIPSSILTEALNPKDEILSTFINLILSPDGLDLSHNIFNGPFGTDFAITSAIDLIETPLAIKNLESISSDVRIRGIALGGLDLSAELGSDMNWDSLIYSRSKIVLHAAINGVYSIDSPFVQINNMEQLEEESQKAKSLGFNSKFAIHPNQIEVISTC